VEGSSWTKRGVGEIGYWQHRWAGAVNGSFMSHAKPPMQRYSEAWNWTDGGRVLGYRRGLEGGLGCLAPTKV
jgi:hypothetical protein